MSGCRRVRRWRATPKSRWRSISIRSIAPMKPRSSSMTSIADHPKDIEAIIELGNIQRGRKEFAECANTYSKAIDRPIRKSRIGWCSTSAASATSARKQWPLAEADMKKALELYPGPAAGAQLSRLFVGRPGRPSRRRHGHDPSRPSSSGRTTATSSIPLAGPISAPAITTRRSKNLERAVELKPEDPTINDHLGDAYWRVGRYLGSALPMVAGEGSQARSGRSAQDRGQAEKRTAADTSSAADASKPAAPSDADKANSAADAEKARRPATAGEDLPCRFRLLRSRRPRSI